MDDLRLTLTYRPATVEVNGVSFEVLRTDAQIVQDVMELAQGARQVEDFAGCNADSQSVHMKSGDFSGTIDGLHTSSHVDSTKVSASPSPSLSPTPALAAYLDTLLGDGARARIAAALPTHPDAPLGNIPSAAVSQAIILQAARAYANAFALRYADAPEVQP